MLHSKFTFLGDSPTEHRLILDVDELRKVQRYAPNLEVNVIPMDRYEDYSTAECISIRGSTFTNAELCNILPLFRALKYLCIPTELVGILGSDLTESLRTIQLVGTGKTRLPSKACHNGVERILSWPVATYFTKEQLPSCRCFYTRLDPRGEILHQIARFEEIEVLTLSGLSSLTSLPRRNWRDVRFLRLQENQFESLRGIEEFPEVTDLFIQNAPKLYEISSISLLQSLREITISYCTNLRSIEWIRGLSLRKLNIFGCPKLKAREVEEIAVSLDLEEYVLNV